jgi:hypothetical protein
MAVAPTRTPVTNFLFPFFGYYLIHFVILFCSYQCKPALWRRLHLMPLPPPPPIVGIICAHAQRRQDFFIHVFNSFSFFLLFIFVQSGVLASIAPSITPPICSHRSTSVAPTRTGVMIFLFHFFFHYLRFFLVYYNFLRFQPALSRRLNLLALPPSPPSINVGRAHALGRRMSVFIFVVFLISFRLLTFPLQRSHYSKSFEQGQRKDQEGKKGKASHCFVGFPCSY